MMSPNHIRGELMKRGVVLCHEAKKLEMSPTNFNNVIRGYTVSVVVQEHIAKLLGMTPEKVFGAMYRPERSRSRRALIKAAMFA